MVNAVTKGVAFDFLVDGERAVLVVITKFHLGGVVASFAVDKIANFGVFHYHFGPERVAGEPEKVGAFVSCNLDNDIGPASKDVLGFLDFFIRQGVRDDFIQGVLSRKKVTHML